MLGHLHQEYHSFVECDTEEEIQTLFDAIASNEGQVMVPLDNYAGMGITALVKNSDGVKTSMASLGS